MLNQLIWVWVWGGCLFVCFYITKGLLGYIFQLFTKISASED